ncbi:hypothetical protein JKP88DRAFT_156846 [Tribonema minus]|uniref:VWFA domain-containing protein n=1 Tax=Tribonema minus TaxID=303371 RepID=A0A835Z7E0_9STRA|nr:hypothetical protein JKP88DRAFT_156846 [Tribonema minus]
MKLPPPSAPSTTFVNAKGSNVIQEYAIAARANPDCIPTMAETPRELKDLQKEALARQYVIIVDRSGSMGAADGRGTHWDSARDAVTRMIDTVLNYDIDHTVPVYIFDNECVFIGEVTKASQVKQIFTEFKPRGTTDLNNVLVEALETYAGTKRPNYELVPGTTFIVLLDGGADDEDAVMKTVCRFADPRNGYVANHTQIAISLCQIGDDPSATRFLKRLDDEIEPDICDTQKDDILSETGGLDRLLYSAIFD